MGKQDIQTKLHMLKPEIMQKYRVREIGFFGSYAHGEQRRGSDIDLLVDLGDDASFFDLVRLGDFLERRLRRKVDIATKEYLRTIVRDLVMKDLVMI